MTFVNEIAQAAEWLKQSDGILICAGAGMGVDSGLPDFRGNDGLWNAYPGLKKHGLGFQEIACPASFVSTPRLAWGFYGHRLDLYRTTVPHEGFAILQAFANSKPYGAFVFTSNVDGQFHKAGYDPQKIVECHGSIHFLQCLENCSEEYWPADDLVVKVSPQEGRWDGALPRCMTCGALVRPNILMFEDGSWVETRSAMQVNRMRQWLAEVNHPVVIELGAGTNIPTVRRRGQGTGYPLIRINPREYSVFGPNAVGIGMGALEGLRAIRDLLRDAG